MSLRDKLTQKGSDLFQTPPDALDMLLPYLPQESIIWEPACGSANIVKKLRGEGFEVIGTDIIHGDDFLLCDLDQFKGMLVEPIYEDITIVTNPPFSLKDEFIEHCYGLGVPWALLMPLTALEGKKRQALYKEHGVEILMPNRRINYIRPFKTEGKSSAHFASAWFTYGLNIGSPLTFVNYNPTK